MFTSFQVLTTVQNEGALARDQKPRTKTSLVNRWEHEARICCTKWGQKPHFATNYGSDAGPPRRSGCVKSGSSIRTTSSSLCFINAHGFARSTGQYRYISITLSPKHAKHGNDHIFPMFHHVLSKGESRGLSKEVLRGSG